MTRPEDISQADIIQADREAVASISEWTLSNEAHRMLLAGELDDRDERVMVFCRHRLAHTPTGETDHDISPNAQATQSNNASVAPMVLGVSRDANNEQCLLVHFASRPTDDELRAFHNRLARTPAGVPREATAEMIEAGRGAYFAGFGDGFVDANIDETGFPDKDGEATIRARIDHVGMAEGWQGYLDTFTAMLPATSEERICCEHGIYPPERCPQRLTRGCRGAALDAAPQSEPASAFSEPPPERPEGHLVGCECDSCYAFGQDYRSWLSRNSVVPQSERVEANPCTKIFDHKWLDPVCVEDGCQSLFLVQALDVLKRLALIARTSGGTAGPDAALMAALDEAEALLVGTLSRPAPVGQREGEHEMLSSLQEAISRRAPIDQHKDIRAATIEECARVARSYEEGLKPPAGWSEDRRDGFEIGVADCSSAIEDAIRALAASTGAVGD